jgi:death-on-curing protein
VYPELGDFCDVAAVVVGTRPDLVARYPTIGLADSALAAPRAGFGDHEVYASLAEKASVLLEHMVRNHPLPDGNKRVAFLLTAWFLECNGFPFRGPSPDVDVAMVEQIAAGTSSTEEILRWLERRVDWSMENRP